MLLKNLISAISLLALVWSGSAQTTPEPNIIPRPNVASYPQGILPQPKRITYRHSVRHAHSIVTYMRGALTLPQTTPVLRLEGAKAKSAWLHFVREPQGTKPAGWYRLSVSSEGVRIAASNFDGERYAIETLRQLYDAQSGGYRYAHIVDAPRYAYRGLMLDVSRHMFPVEYIKNFITEMARVKLNRFHWHLVDGGGWRMESKAYPLLTERAAYRTESDWDKWWHGGKRGFTTKDDPKGYGGYYTQHQIREVVAHATRLGVTIIPEIEMPGHSTELFHAYPDLICPTATAKDAVDVCIGNEATFTFFQRILDEVMTLFPSKYIHIGGDEAAMNHWGQCPRCQKRMQDEKLPDLHALQSYMIRRMERYLSSKGRKLIGWDEILLGGLAPGATVMSWRGEDGGIAAARSRHDVIMSPNGNLYLDYYQNEATDEPRAIGGYVPLQKVYAYNPTPESLSPEEQKHILGVQANLWTEYVYDADHVSYMIFPRALAVAEVGWTQPERKDYDDFRQRVTAKLPELRARGIKAYPMNGLNLIQSYDQAKGEICYQLKPERTDVEVYISDKPSPSPSNGRRVLPNDTIRSRQGMPHSIYAQVYKGKQALLPNDRIYRLPAHAAIGAQVHYNSKWNAKYPAGELTALVDGLYGTPTYLDGRWQGFTEPMDVTLELSESKTLKGVELRFMAEREQWVYMPKSVTVSVSEDGKTFTSLGTLTPKTSDDEPRPTFERFDFPTSLRAKYIRIEATIGRSAGHFIFCDEAIVYAD